jgi:PmbA protein
MMEKTQCEMLARNVVSELAKRGIRDSKAHVVSSDESSLEWRDGSLDTLSGASSATLEVTLFRNGQYAVQSTGDLRSNAITGFLDDAAAFLSLMPSDPHRTPPDPALQGSSGIDLDLLDPASSDASLDERREALASMYDRARSSDARIVEAVATSTQRRTAFADAYSSGFSASHAQSRFELSLTASVLAPDGSRPNGNRFHAARHRVALPPPSEIVDVAISRALGRIGQKKLPSGTFDLVFRNEIASFAVSPFVIGLNGWSLDEKRSIYEGKRGTAVASNSLTLIDDPSLPGGLGSQNFDEDGFPGKKITLVNRGILENYYIGWYYSQKLGETVTTGNCSNPVIVPGTESLESLIAGVNRGILVEGLNGGNSNPATGDFSVGISGFLIENGTLTVPVHEMVASGNFPAFFMSLDGVANDPDASTEYRAPSLRFRGVTVSGV